ncbi:MAG: Smr/MutS family protein [Bdellovibrionales bacterium]|nr:Smr/MutS family protein [Bdellovibrionales bacterium]
MRELDLHGKLVAEAEDIFHEILNEVRMNGRAQEVMFITGVGKIQERLKMLASEQDLNHYVQMGNRGVLVVEFE